MRFLWYELIGASQMQTPDESELDAILARLRDAERASASEDVLSAIRREVTAAGNREAAAREATRDAEELSALPPGFLRGDGEFEPAVMLLPIDGTELPIGASRFGGVPDLPASIGWPTFEEKKLEFLTTGSQRFTGCKPIAPKVGLVGGVRNILPADL